MTWPAPTRKDHEAFCTAEGWQRVRDAQGRAGTHHITYELYLHDGRILRTRISHPVNRGGYGRDMWSHILRDQLDVDEPTFWACVRDGIKPDRGASEPPPEALPADLVRLLLTRVHLTEAEMAAMSKDQAIARMQQHWATGS
jgi:hypothetical protein